jgi:hypothetical protein
MIQIRTVPGPDSVAITFPRSTARGFVEAFGDGAESVGFDQIDEIGLRASDWAGVTGQFADLLRTLRRAQAAGASVAVITAVITKGALDVTVYVESVPEGEEELVPPGDLGPVVPE